MNSKPALSDPNIEEEFYLELNRWFPYRFSWIANEVSLCLHQVYHSRWGISVPGWRIITVLAEFAPLAAKDVAAKTAMDVVQVTRAVNELYNRGLVLRREDTIDRRRVSLRLSASGRKLYHEVVPYAQQLEGELLQGLSTAERDTLAALLDRVQENAGRVASEHIDTHTISDKRKTPLSSNGIA
ncbi:MarR family transcriptional regulator [uncultured Caballeronia sp.]|uniref:MarR family winged helix-turn-helix transcriptional regulator n=1 Tax=uncultured Caballeronia sp. TaxID=1827198 RepID=UPI0015775D03